MQLEKFRRGVLWQLLFLLGVILLVKGTVFLLDATPSFYYGDSEAYLAVATQRWIPPDRSFLYGFLIRRVAFRLHSLQALLYLQASCSCIASWLVGYALLVEIRTRFLVAAICSALCAIEPLQLMMERYVMTEAVSNFLFASQFVLALAYLRRGWLWLLLLCQAIGVLLIGIRISFLPQVLLSSVLVPLLSPFALAAYESFWRGFRNRTTLVRLSKVASHLLLALLISQGLLSAYRHWYGRLAHREPALLYENGAFLISDLAPLVKPSDFPTASQGEAVFRKVTLDLKNIDERLAQHFSPGGLWDVIKVEYPDIKQANRVAERAANRILLRHPVDVLGLAAKTYAEYFDPQRIRSELLVDEGVGGELGKPALAWLKTLYRVPQPQSYQITLTKMWHVWAVPWYWLILLVLPFSPVLLLWVPRKIATMGIFSVVIAETFFVGVTVTVDHPTPRYLTSAAWLVLFLIGLGVSSFQNRHARVKELAIQSRVAG